MSCFEQQEASNMIICQKHNILLMKTSNDNEYILTFTIENNKVDLSAIMDWKIYDLLYSLNKDILSDRFVNTTDTNASEKHFLYVFKRFGAELGISQRYLSFNVDFTAPSRNQILFTGSPHIITSHECLEMKQKYPRTEPIISNFSQFLISQPSKHKLEVSYRYHIDLQEDLPKSMKNIAGILIKKLFWRFKICIENLE